MYQASRSCLENFRLRCGRLLGEHLRHCRYAATSEGSQELSKFGLSPSGTDLLLKVYVPVRNGKSDRLDPAKPPPAN